MTDEQEFQVAKWFADAALRTEPSMMQLHQDRQDQLRGYWLSGMHEAKKVRNFVEEHYA